MNDINPNNYDGANITIVGRAGGPAERKDFAGGGAITELSIAVGKGYKKDGEWVDQGTDWYTLVAAPDYAAEHWPPVGKGDKVRIDNGRFETRAFDRKDGSHDKALTIRFGDLSIIESKGNAPAASEGDPFGGDTGGGDGWPA